MASRKTFLFSQYRQHTALRFYILFVSRLLLTSGILYLNQHHRSDVIYAYKLPLDCYTPYIIIICSSTSKLDKRIHRFVYGV